MGLDSVELVMEWEIFFEIEIPDNQAEKIRTVQHAADCVSSHVKFIERNIDLKSRVFNQLNIALSDLNVIDSNILPEEKIFDLIPATNQERWAEIEQKLNYEVPAPFLKGTIGKFVEKLFPTKTAFENTTAERFVDLICAVNYEKVLVRGQIQNTYEVLIGIMGITIKTQGLNPFEVFPDKSFVDDFGID